MEFSEQYFVDCAFSGSGCAGILPLGSISYKYIIMSRQFWSELQLAGSCLVQCLQKSYHFSFTKYQITKN